MEASISKTVMARGNRFCCTNTQELKHQSKKQEILPIKVLKYVVY